MSGNNVLLAAANGVADRLPRLLSCVGEGARPATPAGGRLQMVGDHFHLGSNCGYALNVLERLGLIQLLLEHKVLGVILRSRPRVEERITGSTARDRKVCIGQLRR